MTTDDPLLAATAVSVSFGGVKALRAVDCHVTASEVVGIIGPNGAGKTTLLNSISRFLPVAAESEIRFAGHDLRNLPSGGLAALGLARTFQTLELSSGSSLWDNVMLGSHHRRPRPFATTARRALESEASEYLELMQIDAWAERRINEVPYAARKRAEICRALMSRPKLVLLDEPASGMSAPEKAQLRTALRQINERTGTAILIIEHDVGFLSELCDRLMAINFGTLLCEGTPSSVVEDPRVIESYLGNQ